MSLVIYRCGPYPRELTGLVGLGSVGTFFPPGTSARKVVPVFPSDKKLGTAARDHPLFKAGVVAPSSVSRFDPSSEQAKQVTPWHLWHQNFSGEATVRNISGRPVGYRS